MLPTLTKADQRKRRRIMHYITRELNKPNGSMAVSATIQQVYEAHIHQLLHDAVTEVLGTEQLEDVENPIEYIQSGRTDRT